MTGGVTIERWLVSNNDAGVLPAGIPVFSCPGGNCKNGISFPSQAKVGMFVFYSSDDRTRTSIDPSATPTIKNIILGQYYSRTKNGVITEILKMAGEKFVPEQLVGGASAMPIVGRGEVGRATFTCVKKNQLYSVKAYIESNRTRQELIRNKKLEVIGQYDTTVNPSCDDCDDNTVCLDITKGIVDDLNGNKNSGDFPEYAREPIPAKFFVYHRYNYEFCLDGIESSCGNCESFTGIKGIDIQGRQVIFGTTLNTATTTHQSQLSELLKKIDCAFEAHQGVSWLGQGTYSDPCVTAKLIINADLGIKLIKHDDSLIEPCNIVDNGAQSCALGWYGELATEGCDCTGRDDNPVVYHPTHVKLEAIDGFIDFTSSLVEEAIIPTNWGVQLWDHQFAADPNPGFHGTIVRTGGIYDNDVAYSRRKGVDIECLPGYCVLSITTTPYGYEPYGIGTSVGRATVRTILALKQSDDNSAILADINAIKNANNCANVSDWACTADPEPGPPTPSVSSSAYASPSVTRSITVSRTATRSITVSRSVTPTITVSRSVTPSISVSPA